MLDSILTASLTVESFLLCTAASLVLGLGTALLVRYKNHTTQSFSITIAVLPAIVQIVIMLVNGDLGAGVAVAGAFSLVRFRSAPGSAREIAAIFLAMALGLATGMGYLFLALLFFLLIALFMLCLRALDFGGADGQERELRITIPEDLDYDGLFDDIFARYTDSFTLERVKTSGMGTLYELRYRIRIKDAQMPKAFLDELRCRNGNLSIVCGKVAERESL